MLTIAEIGVDQLIVDEMQEFRKLSFATNQTTLKGVDPDGSQRAAYPVVPGSSICRPCTGPMG